MRWRLEIIGLALVLAALNGTAQNTFPSSGSVGIGTTVPISALHVVDANLGQITLDAYGTRAAFLGRSASGTQTGPGFWTTGSNMWATGVRPFNGSGFASVATAYISGVATENHSSVGLGSGLAFLTTTNGTISPNERMRIDNNGNVGIGTTNPSYKLDVSGQIHSSNGIVYGDGTQQTTAWTGVLCGGDYAESVDVSGNRAKYEPGDVLVIDHDNQGKFLKSAEPYSTFVTGIYSTKPGLLGRRQSVPQSPDEIPMAMTGIVPTKVTTENGAIRPGDLLVTSSTSGFAMKGTDRSRMLGTVIGKALGNLNSGTGVIEVVVTLQ